MTNFNFAEGITEHFLDVLDVQIPRQKGPEPVVAHAIIPKERWVIGTYSYANAVSYQCFGWVVAQVSRIPQHLIRNGTGFKNYPVFCCCKFVVAM